MAKITVNCELSDISDGLHTMEELYRHIHLLFCAFMVTNPKSSWISTKHSDGSIYDKGFIAGTALPNGQYVSYYLPYEFWELLVDNAYIKVLDRSPTWSTDMSKETLTRLKHWLYS